MEHPSIIFKIVCPDRPGLVSLLSTWISNYGGNIKHSDHHTDQDAGLFLSRIEWNSDNAFFNRDEIYKEFEKIADEVNGKFNVCLLYTSPSPRDLVISRMPSSA